MSWFDPLLNWITAHGVAGSALVAAIVAFTVFLLTRITEIVLRSIDRRASRKRVVIGLFKEVRSNLASVEQFLDASPYPAELREKVKRSAKFRPMMIVDETTQFYDSITASLPDIESDCLMALSEFYAKIHKVINIAAAFESAAFPTISAEGRASTVDDLWLACRMAEKGGWKALYELELAYPRKWFKDFKL